LSLVVLAVVVVMVVEAVQEAIVNLQTNL